MTEPGARIRLDKWLWQARFFKARTRAAQEIAAGHVRVNGTRITKPAQAVGPGDVLTFVQGAQLRVVRILAPGLRRGPAPEAQALYQALDAPAGQETVPPSPRYEAKGRPTKRDRRKLDLIGPGALE